MPFDAAPVVRSPLPDNIAGQSALVLDMVEFYFQSGAKWQQHLLAADDGRRCLLGAVQFVRLEIGSEDDRAFEYLIEAITGVRPLRSRGGFTTTFLQRYEIFRFNDGRGRKYPEIAALLRKARELAEADARAQDEEVKRIAVDCDPIEARVIDEALKILGPNGEKWIKGREADQQHNHCIIGAIKLAQRRLKVENDGTKRFILDEVYRNSRHFSIETFNDTPGRRFNSVREIMLRAKCEAEAINRALDVA